uniref:Trimethyllysine dioxygenase, mitochondrial n=1 Tax=Lutzomyia longipalpis TaxID=7200 RepID=A0A1B0CUK0_LUTLO
MQATERKKRACVVPVCKDERFDLVHKLPMNQERAEEWVTNLDIPELATHSIEDLRKRIFVCSRHFRRQDYKNIESRCLNKTAVPSINLKALDNFNVIDPKVMVKSYPEAEAEIVAPPVPPKLPPRVQRNLTRVVRPVKLREAALVKTLKKRRFTEEVEEILDSHFSMNINIPKVPKTDGHVVPTNHYFIQSREKSQRSGKEEELLEIYVNLPAEVQVQKSLVEAPQLVMSSEFIEVPSRSLKLNYFWLRDHCRCSECYNHRTNQRSFSFLSLPPDVKAKSCQFSDDFLAISWNDGHESQYSWDFLTSHASHLKQSVTKRILWDAEKISQSAFARVSLGDLMADEEAARSVVESLVCYGVAFVDKVPANVSCTELAIKRLFPIHKTFFGEMWTFQSGVMKESDTAYTHEALGAHTDNTYFCDPAGLQVLHCTEFEGDGGESLLVDGYRVASEVKKKHPEVYARLCSTAIPFEYKDDTHHHAYTAPLIKEDKVTGSVEQIRFNLYDRAPLDTLPYDEIQQFYSDLRVMAAEVASEGNEWWFKLSPGTVMIFDNWRLLHGRAALTGKRSMCGCYVARTDFLSVARKMKLVD